MQSPRLTALKNALDLLDSPTLAAAQRRTLREKVKALHLALSPKEVDSIDPNRAAAKGNRTLAAGLAAVAARVRKEGLRAEIAALPAGFTIQDRVGRQIMATIGTTTLLLDPTEAECLTLAQARNPRDVPTTLATLGMRRLRAGLPPIPQFNLSTLTR